jgi:hypothetical protein
MHTKTFIGISLMMLLVTLSLLAISTRLNNDPGIVIGEINSTIKEQADNEPVVSGELGGVENVIGSERRTLPGNNNFEKLVGEERFVGTLEEVNIGCFADGECYVVVDGKHVTTMIGWSDAAVGSILGVEGFGDLEYFIGEQVAVFAGKKEDGTYTLYQKDDYNVTLIGAYGVATTIGKGVEVAGRMITPKRILEDSRCPVGMMCIQAGTLVLETEVRSNNDTKTIKTELGVPVVVGGVTIKLLRADPLMEEDFSASGTFYFGVWN